MDVFESDAVHIINRRGECDGAFDVGGAGFVFERWIVVGCVIEGHLFDHFAAALPGRKFFEQIFAAPEDTDAGGCVNFVAGEHKEIGADRLDISWQVGDRLRGIDEYDRTNGFRGLGHFGDRVDRAKGVGNRGESEDFDWPFDCLMEGIEVERAVVVAGDDFEFCAGALAEHLPWHDVGVVLECGD